MDYKSNNNNIDNDIFVIGSLYDVLKINENTKNSIFEKLKGLKIGEVSGKLNANRKRYVSVIGSGWLKYKLEGNDNI